MTKRELIERMLDQGLSDTEIKVEMASIAGGVSYSHFDHVKRAWLKSRKLPLPGQGRKTAA
jgi:hypothetical protein